jgi:hypothetical protein
MAEDKSARPEWSTATSTGRPGGENGVSPLTPEVFVSEELLPIVTLLVGLLIPALGRAGRYLADWKQESAKRREQRREAVFTRRREALSALLQAYRAFSSAGFHHDPTGGEEDLTRMQVHAVESGDAAVNDAVEVFIAGKCQDGHALRRVISLAFQRLDEEELQRA